MRSARQYDYVGPFELLDPLPAGPGQPITSQKDLDEVCLGEESMTFVVDIAGVFRVAPRQSEHVACAQGQPVLAAGEVSFARRGDGWFVDEITNQSTGYCPEPASWSSCADALNRAELGHPGRYTSEFVFRRCASCGERNVVKDSWYVCAACDADLPHDWNFD